MANKQNQDELFLKWLSPSYWLVEGQLSSVRKQRGKDTLEWARTMPEFEVWRRSDSEHESKDRILWIRGTLGVGKTVMAGYFIELLKCLHPDAVVAYFFCRSGQERLKTARDIIRTLAYQCVIDDAEARSALDSLRTKDFRVNDETPVGFLVEKLLQEPLSRTKNMIFIIIDGVDEADWTSIDNSERQPRPEMEAFIKAIGNIPSIHLLFVSRPKPDISRMIPNAATKSLVKSDNMVDIDAYVKTTIEGSERLKEHFLNENVNPSEYFHNKANGIFLWVVVVLHQLLQIKAGSVFRKYLSGFSDASGDMEKLYSSVLMSIQNEDQKWIKEILKWLVVSQRELTVDELKAVVEWSQHDNIPIFQTFLEVDCGALVHLVPIQSKGFNVQLIHETLRSFLINVHDCPAAFYVEEKASHIFAARICLDILSISGEDKRNDFIEYAARHWHWHIARSRDSEQQTSDLLASLYCFFRLSGCKRWVEVLSIRPDEYNIDIQLEEYALQLVHNTLKAMPQDDTISSDHDKDQHDAAIKWRMAVLETPWILGYDVGKTAAQIWLYEDLPCDIIAAAFRLALKYYCRGQRIPLDDIEVLQELATNDFINISNHLVDRKRDANTRNLGIGYFVLRLWTDAVIRLKAVVASSDNEREILAYLGLAYLNLRDYEQSKNSFEIGGWTPRYNRQYYYCLEMLSLVYKAKGNMDGAVNTLKNAEHTIWIKTRGVTLALGEIYSSLGDYRSEIALYRSVFDVPDQLSWWERQLLANAYIKDGNQESVVQLYQQNSVGFRGVDTMASGGPITFKNGSSTTGILLHA